MLLSVLRTRVFWRGEKYLETELKRDDLETHRQKLAGGFCVLRQLCERGERFQDKSFWRKGERE